MSAHRHDHDTPETVRRAEGWVDEHTQPAGGRPKGLEDVEGTPGVDALRRQQHREMRRTGLGTEGQFHGAMAGTVIGGLLGAVLGLLVGWFFLEDLDTVWRIVLSLVLGAAAGAAAGFVYLGGRTPELENETLTAQGEPQIGSSPRDPRRDDRGR
jgi:hypothetical protein